MDSGERPGIMGVHEVAGRLGVGRQRVHQLLLKEGFPAPVRLRCGLVWYAPDVEAWIAKHRPALARATAGYAAGRSTANPAERDVLP